MARKRREVFDLRKLSKDDPQYWEEVLRRKDLLMDRGDSFLSYIGGCNEVEIAARPKSGRTAPKETE